MPRIAGSVTLVIEGEEYKIPRLDFIKFLDAMETRLQEMQIPDGHALDGWRHYAPAAIRTFARNNWRRIKPGFSKLEKAIKEKQWTDAFTLKSDLQRDITDTANYLAMLYWHIEQIDANPDREFYDQGETCEIDCPNCGTGIDLRLERAGYIFGDQGFGRHQNGICGVCNYKYAIKRDTIIKRLWPSENVGEVNGPADGIHWTPK